MQCLKEKDIKYFLFKKGGKKGGINVSDIFEILKLFIIFLSSIYYLDPEIVSLKNIFCRNIYLIGTFGGMKGVEEAIVWQRETKILSYHAA